MGKSRTRNAENVAIAAKNAPNTEPLGTFHLAKNSVCAVFLQTALPNILDYTYDLRITRRFFFMTTTAIVTAATSPGQLKAEIVRIRQSFDRPLPMK